MVTPSRPSPLLLVDPLPVGGVLGEVEVVDGSRSSGSPSRTCGRSAPSTISGVKWNLDAKSVMSAIKRK